MADTRTDTSTVTTEPSQNGQGDSPDRRLFIRSLELHGYKTFAGRTLFEFGPGITAIVGPNGSGKSNIADAVRWLLGEQRLSRMRAKRTEDMIFNGTDRRARMGMAQAFLTLDNRAGLLPVDFAEVVIGRRAYRSGENEYLLNGNRVRLKDIQELLAHAGLSAETYTVIGQGLVDMALSLRPEERRRMIEDAAGLGAYYGKRNETMRRLAETEENLRRARDIVAELEPRLRRLRRQAERAERHRQLTEELHNLLRRWYGYQWGQALEQIAQARQHVARAQHALERAQQDVTQAEARARALRGRLAQVRQQLDHLRRERARRRGEVERLRREQAIRAERARLLARQVTELEEELAALHKELRTLEARGTELEEERRQLETAHREAQAALAAERVRLREAEKERSQLRQKLERARREQARLVASLAELDQTRVHLARRQEELEREQQDHQKAQADLARRLARHEGEIRLLEEEIQELEAQRSRLLAERGHLEDLMAAARNTEHHCEQAVHDIEHEISRLEARRELLARLRAEGSGYQEGVRALLQAARQGELAGILGPIAHFPSGA
ncbi:MAG: ATP-binding protein [Ardenticatenia bacterium]|nr:ATP-binding protein [Ardenticatenia bacterium]